MFFSCSFQVSDITRTCSFVLIYKDITRNIYHVHILHLLDGTGRYIVIKQEIIYCIHKRKHFHNQDVFMDIFIVPNPVLWYTCQNINKDQARVYTPEI